MKIGGPDGPDGVKKAAGEAVDPREKAQASEFEALLSADSSPSAPAGEATSVEALQAQLRSGELTGAEAVDRLVETMVARYTASLGPQMAEIVRQQFEETLKNDPFVAEKLKTLIRGG